LSTMGLDGYRAKITGGSDAQGFPMKKDLEGSIRKKVFVNTDKKRGIRKRLTARGNAIAEDIKQINVVIVKEGSTQLETLFPKGEKETELTAKEKVMEGVREEQDKAGLKEEKEEAVKEEGKKEEPKEEKKAEGKEEKKEESKEESGGKEPAKEQK